MERIDAALQKRGEEYLDAVRRSILEDIIIEKTHVKRLPDGTEIKEIHKETRPPDIKGALWWLERGGEPSRVHNSWDSPSILTRIC